MKILRAIEPEDLDLMYLIENDMELWKHSSTTAPFSYYSLRQYLEQTQNDLYKDGQVRFAIGNSGFLDITDFSAIHRRAQLGIVLTRESQGRGVATRALDEAAEYSRQTGIHQLWAVVSETNTQAQRLFHRAGYKDTAILDDWLLTGNNYIKGIIYQKIL